MVLKAGLKGPQDFTINPKSETRKAMGGPSEVYWDRKGIYGTNGVQASKKLDMFWEVQMTRITVYWGLHCRTCCVQTFLKLLVLPGRGGGVENIRGVQFRLRNRGAEPQTRILVESFRWTPHPVIVTIRDNRDCIRVLLYSYYTTITGWGVLLKNPGEYSPHSLLLEIEVTSKDTPEIDMLQNPDTLGTLRIHGSLSLNPKHSSP